MRTALGLPARASKTDRTEYYADKGRKAPEGAAHVTLLRPPFQPSPSDVPWQARPDQDSSTCPDKVEHETCACLGRGKKTQVFHHGRVTFKEILGKVRPSNICRLKNRAFGANQVAKVTFGKSRRICYRLKSDTINSLVKLGLASFCTIELSLEEPLIGVAFVGGGKLHTLSSHLDSETRALLQEQLMAAIHGRELGARPKLLERKQS